MTQDELQALIDEGKTIDEILFIRGESAEELLSEKRSVVTPTDVLEGAILDDYSHPQLVSLIMTILNFSRGNYRYTPKEKIPNSVCKNLMNFIADNNDKYLFAHVQQSIKGARGGRPKKSKRPKPTAFDENPRQATETHGFQKTPVPAEETPKTEATESHGLPQKAYNVNAYANDNAYAKENVKENFCSSSKDNKGVGEEEKSPYFVQQSQEAAGQPQFSLATPQQSQPVEETQQPSLATPQQQVATQAKFSVGQQSQLSLSVSETIGLITHNGCNTYKKALATIREHGGNIDVQKTIAALYFLTGKSQPEVSEITGLMDKIVNKGARREEGICKEVFNMATDTKASDGCNFTDENSCRAATDAIKDYLNLLLAKPQGSTRYIDPNEKLPF